MKEYSMELKNNVEKISKYYEENDTFEVLNKIIKFIEDILNYHIPEKYFVIGKKHIKSYMNEAMKIWEKDGNEKELEKIRKLYLKILNEEKPFEKIMKNKKENAAMNCMISILYNGHNDPQNQFAYDFIELFIKELEVLEIDENIINSLLEKYFNKIVNA
jgi:hypothetical protein